MDPRKAEEKSKSLYKNGTRVTVKTAQQTGLTGTVRFYGTMQGSTGSWVGVELDAPLGKCNGSQNGVKYFECKTNCGIFARSTQVKIIEEETSISKMAPVIKPKKEEVKIEEPSEDIKDNSRMLEEAKLKIAEKKQKIIDQIRKDKTGDPKDEAKKDLDPNLELALAQKEDTIKFLKEDLHKASTELDQAKKALISDSSLISELKNKVSLLESQIRSRPGHSQDINETIEALTLEKEVAEETIEHMQKEIDDLRQELVEAREEIELRNLELEELQAEATEVTVEDVKDYDSTDYKLALKKLYAESQNAKYHYENRIQQLENQLADIPKVDLLKKHNTDLKAEIVAKEKKILELKEAFEEASTHSEMVEKLTNELYNLNEKMNELQQKCNDLQEIHDLDEQIAEGQADIEKNLNAEIAEKDFVIQNLKNEITKMEMQKTDFEKTINQFRLRVCELQNDCESLKEQLADTGEEEKMKKMQVLMEKNVMINNKMREMMGMHINGKLSEVLYTSLLSKVAYMEQSIPDNVLELLDMGTLTNYLLLSSLRGKTYILISEVIRITIDTPHDKYLIRWVANLATLCINLIYDLSSIEDNLRKLPQKEYSEFIKLVDWGQMLAINSNIDNFLKLLKEGGISSTVSLDNFNYSVGIIHHFCLQSIQDVSGANLMSRGCLQLSLGIYCLLQMYALDDGIAGAVDYKDLLSKSLSLGKTLLEIADDEASPLKSLAEILSSRFSKVTKILFDNEIIDYSSYSWVDWFVASDKDIKSILNLSVLKKSEPKKNTNSWAAQAKVVKEKLNKFEETSRELEESKANLKAQGIKIAKLEKDLSELKIAKTSLESRLADAHAKSQRLAQLEIEKKRLQDREKYYEESLEAINTELEKAQKENKILNEELSSFKEKEEDNKIQSAASMISNESSVIGLLRGSMITRHGAGPVGQDELETFSAIIDHYKIQKRQLSSQILKSQIREIPKFANLESNPAKPKLDSIYAFQSKIKKDISKLRVVDLTDKESFERVSKEKENLRANTLAAKKTMESLQNLINSDGGYGSFIHTGPTGTLGKVVLGKGNNVIPVSISLEEFKGFRKILNLN